MEAISDLVRSTIPNYFSNLPIPRTFGGWFSLSGNDSYTFTFFQLNDKNFDRNYLFMIC